MRTCTCHQPAIHAPHDADPGLLLDLGWTLFREADDDGRIGYNGGGWWFLDGKRIRGLIETIVALLDEEPE